MDVNESTTQTKLLKEHNTEKKYFEKDDKRSCSYEGQRFITLKKESRFFSNVDLLLKSYDLNYYSLKRTEFAECNEIFICTLTSS